MIKKGIFIHMNHNPSIIHAVDRHAEKAGDNISPNPCSSTLNTSITGDFSNLRILQVPSSRMVFLSPNGS